MSRRMKPEERLLAYLQHSQLIHRIYDAGVRHRRKSPFSFRKGTLR
ncbi:MAG: hypothetical protein HYZ90_06395 [Candidatus Omnitrophica bacterium]|nr:hypothetical protein [Candidatus Omnitrophota bacterium]